MYIRMQERERSKIHKFKVPNQMEWIDTYLGLRNCRRDDIKCRRDRPSNFEKLELKSRLHAKLESIDCFCCLDFTAL